MKKPTETKQTTATTTKPQKSVFSEMLVCGSFRLRREELIGYKVNMNTSSDNMLSVDVWSGLPGAYGHMHLEDDDAHIFLNIVGDPVALIMQQKKNSETEKKEEAEK